MHKGLGKATGELAVPFNTRREYLKCCVGTNHFLLPDGESPEYPGMRRYGDLWCSTGTDLVHLLLA